MNKNTEDFGTNHANTVIKPRKALLDVEPSLVTLFQGCLERIAWRNSLKFVLQTTVGVVILWIICSL